MFINNSFLKDFKNTIGYLLFKKIFFAYIFLVLLLTASQIYREYSFAKTLILKDVVNAEKSFGNVLAKTVWHFDENKIKAEVKAIIDAKTITGVSIITPLNEILAVEGIVSDNELKYKEFVFDSYQNSEILVSNKIMKHNFDLIDKTNSPDEVLGIVNFYVEENKIFDTAKEGIYIILINTIVSALILWLLFIYFANKLLTIPLNQLINATKELTLKEYNEVEISLNTEHKHELNTLADTFNKMSKRINESYTNLKQLTILQDKQKKELVEANRYKNDFLANMSHELKTPLNSINVISSVMMKNKNNSLDEKQIKNLAIINNCGNDLLYLINDVLDISKLEAGEVKLDFKQENVFTLMTEIKDMFEPQIHDKKLNLIFECDINIGEIFSDKNRIKQIVKNLLSNALKFTKEGTISFIVKDSKDSIVVTIKDEGIGIEENKLEHIFDRFKQADGSTTRKYGGTGLGLAICKELLVLLNGNISVRSKIKHGTVFTILIPKNKDRVKKESISKVNKIVNSNNKKILLLNNDPVSFLVLAVELKKRYDLIHVATLEDLVIFNQQDNYERIIIDISKENKHDMEVVLNKIKNKIIIVYDEEIDSKIENLAYLSYKKPLDKQLILSEIFK